MPTTRKTTTRTPKQPTNIADKQPANTPAAPSTLKRTGFGTGGGGGSVLDPSRLWDTDDGGDTFQHRLAVTFPNEEIYVTCRTVDVADVVLEGNFPYEFTSQMLNGLASFAGDEGALDAFRNAGESATDVLAAMTAMPQLRPFVDALFVSAVIDPPCFLDKEEARAEGGLWVGHVRLMDKMSLMARMQGEGDGLAATFRPAADAAV